MCHLAGEKISDNRFSLFMQRRGNDTSPFYPMDCRLAHFFTVESDNVKFPAGTTTATAMMKMNISKDLLPLLSSAKSIDASTVAMLRTTTTTSNLNSLLIESKTGTNSFQSMNRSFEIGDVMFTRNLLDSKKCLDVTNDSSSVMHVHAVVIMY
jgi:hypothetical protein